MLVRLYSQATMTPKTRTAIQTGIEPAWVLAERHGTTDQTVWKWRKCDCVHGRSHTPHHFQTTLTPAQEAVAVELRKTLLVSLDDLLAVLREFLNPNVSRSGLDRCLRIMRTDAIVINRRRKRSNTTASTSRLPPPNSAIQRYQRHQRQQHQQPPPLAPLLKAIDYASPPGVSSARHGTRSR